MSGKRLFLAAARGFCGGVRSALDTLDKLVAATPGKTVYVFHELVHNRHVTDHFARRGVRFVASLDEVPENAVLLLGAHGVSRELEAAARRRTKHIADATCPLVKARQREAAKLTPGDSLILVGHSGHPEVVGVLGWSNAGQNFVIAEAAEAGALPGLEHPVLLSQTTFDAFELEKCRETLLRRFPDLQCRGGLCRASLERQSCVAELAKKVEAVVVAGSRHSSNAQRLREAAERAGARGILAECADDVPEEVFTLSRVGLTAGASTPDEDISKLERRFAAAGFEVVK